MGMVITVKRGDIVLVNLEPVKGSEQGRIRPALIIQNDIGNQHSPTTIIAPITSKRYLKKYPTNIEMNKEESQLDKDSTILLNQIRAIDKSRILKKLSTVSNQILKEVDSGLRVSLNL